MTAPANGAPLRTRGSREWLDLFRANEEPEDLPEGGPRLSGEERASVVRSVQEFQLGENSEGKHLHRLAGDHAEKTGDGDYLLVIEYFIREEQRHARYLKHFLVSEGFGTVKGSWADAVFRRLRRLANLEVSVGVLVTAEIIAKVYYAALEGATRSPTLRAICERVQRDEKMHVQFQAERLAILRRDRSLPGMVLTRLLHRALFCGACLVVWRNHGEAVRRGGLRFRAYWRRCWDEFGAARRAMEPAAYTDL
ncbi:MAG: hypothetical protein AVDCRST_MAG02-4140 [uncultured Rubrobacteraceae bacterium]|uniref:Ferritin-like domain-containing protein n=1 Tax=uncultured Rubrobacteraceae bacterium TaxID=349277 RepID=A0A6J4RLE1_9ACTN|nr:MAG: hypothetical protein AVDCRST_MAG02-4140 [uncultured Rubrobacteraceae bacterium]